MYNFFRAYVFHKNPQWVLVCALLHCLKLYCLNIQNSNLHCTKTKCSNKDFFSKCDQICSFQRIWSHLLKKSLFEKLIFCAALYGTTSFFKLFFKADALTDNITTSETLRKNCPYSEFSGPHLPPFGLHMEIYRVNIRIQSEYWKIRTRKIPNTNIFYAVKVKDANKRKTNQLFTFINPCFKWFWWWVILKPFFGSKINCQWFYFFLLFCWIKGAIRRNKVWYILIFCFIISPMKLNTTSTSIIFQNMFQICIMVNGPTR